MYNLPLALTRHPHIPHIITLKVNESGSAVARAARTHRHVLMQFLMAFDAFPMRERERANATRKKKLHAGTRKNATPGIHYNITCAAAASPSPSARVNEVQRAVIEFNNVCASVWVLRFLKCFSSRLRHDCSQYSYFGWAGTHLQTALTQSDRKPFWHLSLVKIGATNERVHRKLPRFFLLFSMFVRFIRTLAQHKCEQHEIYRSTHAGILQARVFLRLANQQHRIATCE